MNPEKIITPTLYTLCLSVVGYIFSTIMWHHGYITCFFASTIMVCLAVIVITFKIEDRSKQQ